MKFRMFLSALLLAASLASVAGEKGTPTETVNKIVAAVKELDFDTVAKMYEGKEKKEIEKIAQVVANAKNAAATGNAEAKQLYEEAKAGFAKFNIEVRREKIEGDFAVLDTVTTNVDGGTKEEKTYLKKINGEWKMIDLEDYKPAAAKKKKPETPSEALMMMIAAVKELDYDTVVQLSYGREKIQSEKMRADFERLKKQLAFMDEASAKQVLETMKAQFSNYDVEIKSEKIEGDFAVIVTVAKRSPSDSGIESNRYLRKVNGEWKVISEVDYKPANK